MKGARIFLECLREEGVKTVFGYPGGQVIPLFDCLYDFPIDWQISFVNHQTWALSD